MINVKNIFKVYRNGIWKYESKLNFVDKKS
jgi:hypothetical protein